MKKILLIAIVAFWTACEPKQGKSVDTPPSNSLSRAIVVEEVLQANNYTYILADDAGESVWMAIPKTDVTVGNTYYYIPGMEMQNFKSKDLDREFEKIYFLSGISENPATVNKIDGIGEMPNDEFHTKQSPDRQAELNIQPAEGITPIGSLYKNPEEFENKKIKVQGVVTKFNPAIMDRNWVHIQDGTGGEGGFDLTITTQDMTNVGEIAAFEGVLVLNKDFGAGYKYDLILEEASKLNKERDIKVN